MVKYHPAVDFGGGARFWFNDHLSLAPTVSGIYGHTENSYTANGSPAKTTMLRQIKLD
jgi:hypothetical protein